MPNLEPLVTRPESLAEIVHSAIREAIVTRQLPPGDQLTENTIAQQLGVSKTPVREALLKLEYIGLIESGDSRGLRVVRPSRQAIESAYQVRTGLEVQAVRILAGGPDPDVASRLRSVAQECLTAAEANDREGFRTGDRRFHMAMAGATGNELLARLIEDAFDLTWTLRRRDVPDRDGSLECAGQHVRIVEAIEANDPDLADRSLREHLWKVQDLVLAAFDAVESRDGSDGHHTD